MPAAEKIVIAKTEYSREEFKAKLIGNNWKEDGDGKVIDALFDSYFKAQKKNEAASTYETKSELKRGGELYEFLFDTKIAEKSPAKNKREILRELGKWESIADEEKRVIEEYMNGLAFEVMRERHEADKEGFLESMKWGGWDRPGDEVFLGKLYDQRFDKDGNLNKEIEGFLNNLDKETSGLEGNREMYLKELKAILEKKPEGERTEDQTWLFEKANV